MFTLDLRVTVVQLLFWEKKRERERAEKDTQTHRHTNAHTELRIMLSFPRSEHIASSETILVWKKNWINDTNVNFINSSLIMFVKKMLELKKSIFL